MAKEKGKDKGRDKPEAPPVDAGQESLFREVEEDLQRERYASLWKRYGSLVVGAGWWSSASASNASRTMKPTASRKLPKVKVLFSFPPSYDQPGSDATAFSISSFARGVLDGMSN